MEYEICREVVNQLEAVKKYKLKGEHLRVLIDFVYKYQIRDLNHLNKVAEVLLSVNSKSSNSVVTTPQGLLDAEIVEKEIRPEISKIREEVFGSGKQPFLSKEDALKWLDGHKTSEEELILNMRSISDGELNIFAIEHMVFLSNTPPCSNL